MTIYKRNYKGRYCGMASLAAICRTGIPEAHQFKFQLLQF